MLKRIPGILSPDLFKALMDMGHSDSIVLADANYPAITHAKRILRMDGAEIPALLEAMLPFFPLDSFVDHSVRLMEPLTSEPIPEIWDIYKKIILKYDDEKAFKSFTMMQRHDFYQQSQSAYMIVQTATTARYANIALQKGVV